MESADYAFFKENGYVSLGKILSDAEVEHFVHSFDRDRTEVEDHWYRIGHYQTVNCDALLTSPEFDNVVRHPIVMDCLYTLMGNAPCFSEICIRHMAPYDGELNRGWHRDGPRHWLEHPLRIGFIQLMLYLTDVDETTHCFSLSPESVEAEILETDEQLERGGIVDLYGPAGTAILFNIGVLHTATTRPTQEERKTVQVYYGHPNRRYLSEDSIIPAELWRDHPDPEARAFYSVFNNKTRDYLEHTASTGELPFEDTLVLLRELDVKHRKRPQ